MGLAEAAGRVVGNGLGVVTGLGAALRQARFFHPRGRVWHGQAVVAPEASGPFLAVAERLQGPVLARLSSAMWKRKEWPDVLGLALRFRRDASSSAEAGPHDQDLLLATVWRSWTTPLAPFFTHRHDFFANRYYAVSPFAVDGLGRVYFRAVPMTRSSLDARARSGASTREERLSAAVRSGTAKFLLEARRAGSRGTWRPLVSVALEAPAEVDAEALRFWPYRDGRGVHPRGFVHALRIGTYAKSQGARPLSATEGSPKRASPGRR